MNKKTPDSNFTTKREPGAERKKKVRVLIIVVLGQYDQHGDFIFQVACQRYNMVIIA